MRKMTLGIKAKDLIEEITLVQIQPNNLRDFSSIEKENVDNKIAVLNMLRNRGINLSGQI